MDAAVGPDIVRILSKVFYIQIAAIKNEWMRQWARTVLIVERSILFLDCRYKERMDAAVGPYSTHCGAKYSTQGAAQTAKQVGQILYCTYISDLKQRSR
jgi:hypothetical protein